MATVTYHIYSHYNPQDKPEHDDSWERDAPRIQRPAPYFVPAAIPYDECTPGWSKTTPTNSLGASLSGWYRSLTSTSRGSTPSDSTAIPNVSNPSNWFIKNPIQSEPSSSTSTPPSLAEILERDPPPLPSEQKYTPPVWLEIGPSNKGFGMLQRAGWNEGEALGPDIVRRQPLENMLPTDEIFETRKVKGKAKTSLNPSFSPVLRKEIQQVKLDDMGDVTELRSVDVIDLSLWSDESGSDPSSSEEDDIQETSPPGSAPPCSQEDHMQGISDNPAYQRKALLTPIATVLKSDRLGIGLKAKTVGPYKSSAKRITHNAAALAAHIRAAEESKRRSVSFGRGRRGFERRHKKEEERRLAMIAHLKAS